jgi:GH43 family beta-xylosidase
LLVQKLRKRFYIKKEIMREKKKIETTYLNPVHDRPCADPYVLKYLNEYWCYCTGIWYDGLCFGVLHSRDLLHWREVGGAMERLNKEATCYWAPEVIYDNGRFLMYYSVGNEESMEIRLAIAKHPQGPFIDAGRGLTSEQFAIDPHVFKDGDGTWYLFYATDFLEHTHIGTGTVCDVLVDEFTLEGNPRPVTRARFDWQVYDPQRAEKGGVRWHTVEGPFVLKRKNIYYQMFSGGNWKNKTYGASYATSDSILRDDEWKQIADGERVLPILQTVPGQVVGPGHNSATRGTDNLETYCVYHRWADDNSARVLAIDRMDWAGERMFVVGPSTTPQPAPNPATWIDFFDEDRDESLGEGWSCIGGKWMARKGAAMQEAQEGLAEARCLYQASHFIAELNLRRLSESHLTGSFGVTLGEAGILSLRFTLLPETNQAVIEWQPFDEPETNSMRQDFNLPRNFDMNVYHHIRLESNGSLVRVALDENILRWEGRTKIEAQSITLWTEDAAAAFAGFALTHGWVDTFMESYSSPYSLGWHIEPTDKTWQIGDQYLWHSDPQKVGSVISKGPLPENYELVVNAKLFSEADANNCYGFLPRLIKDGVGPLFTVERIENRWALRCERAESPRIFPLPANFDPYLYQQFRFRKRDGELLIQHESSVLGKIELSDVATQIGLYASGVTAAFDMVRVTAI